MIKKLLKTIEMEPNWYAPHLLLGMSYEQIGEFSKAIAEFETVLQLRGRSKGQYIGHAYAVAGMGDEARKVLEKYKLRSHSPYGMAAMYTGLGDKDQAFKWLEKGLKDRAETLIFLKVDPYWDNLRADPRFSALLAKMGFE